MKDKNGVALGYGDTVTDGSSEYKVFETDRIWVRSDTVGSTPIWFHGSYVTKVNPVLDRFGNKIEVGDKVYHRKLDVKDVIKSLSGEFVRIQFAVWESVDLVVCK